MAQPSAQHIAKKRKLHDGDDVRATKDERKPRPASLLGPHEAIIAELAVKNDVLPASVISSSKIRQRTVSATTHLLATDASGKPRVVLLYARTDCLSKLITIAETVKRVLSQEDKSWWQYNQMYEQAERIVEEKKDVIEETVLERGNAGEDEDDDDETTDYFETMGSRLEQAIQPAPMVRTTKSLRIFLATGPVLELKTKKGVTLQTNSSN
ncbi:hypothetical protein LIA77_09278 [Sarocladium implicatum]|nr:hypothetical protein LIA77_09278 [Sarocladium implicatum]